MLLTARKICHRIIQHNRGGGFCVDEFLAEVHQEATSLGTFHAFFLDVCRLWRDGCSPSPACLLVAETINYNLAHTHNIRRLESLGHFRTSVALILAILGRVAIAERINSIGIISAEDGCCWLLAIAINRAAHFIHHRYLPRCWLENSCETWLQGILGNYDVSHPLHAQLRSLEEQELLHGASYATQKLTALQDWAATQLQDQSTKLDRYTDLLPLLDILGLGLPMLLLLAAPILEKL